MHRLYLIRSLYISTFLLQTFLGQKYGDPLLPVTIDEAEFEVIRTAMEEDYNREVQAAAAAAAAAEESKRREEEAKKQQQEKAKKMEVLRRMQNVEEEEEGEEEEEEEGEYDTDEEEAELGGTTTSLNRDVTLKATSSGVTRDRSVSFDSAVKTGNPENQVKTKRRLSVALREARPNRMDKLRKTAKNTGKEVMTSRFFRREVSSVKEGPGELVDPALLKSWYRLDTNTIPAVYRLQNIRWVLYVFIHCPSKCLRLICISQALEYTIRGTETIIIAVLNQISFFLILLEIMVSESHTPTITIMCKALRTFIAKS